jgi:hypothetical protein
MVLHQLFDQLNALGIKYFSFSFIYVMAKINWWPLMDGGLILPIMSMPQPLNGHGLMVGFTTDAGTI